MPDGRARGVPGVGRDRWHYVGAAGEPPFQNNWVNYAAWADAAYRRDEDGIVWLKGLIRNGTVPATAFTLPPGYRTSAKPGGPTDSADNLIFVVLSNSVQGRLDVYADGRVYVSSPSSGLWVSLSGIAFFAED